MANFESQSSVALIAVQSASEAVMSRTAVFAAIPHGSTGNFVPNLEYPVDSDC